MIRSLVGPLTCLAGRGSFGCSLTTVVAGRAAGLEAPVLAASGFEPAVVGAAGFFPTGVVDFGSGATDPGLMAAGPFVVDFGNGVTDPGLMAAGPFVVDFGNVVIDPGLIAGGPLPLTAIA